MVYTTGALNQIYAAVAISALVIVGWQWIRIGGVDLNALSYPAMLTMLAFCSLYCGIGEHSIQGILYYFVCPVLAFLAGWVCVEAGQKSPEETIKCAIYCMALGYTIHAFLNYTTNIGHVRWMLTDFFTHKITSATVSGYINTLVFSLSMYFLVVEKNRALKLGGIAATAISLLYALLLGTRTQFIILGFISVLLLFLYMTETRGGSGLIYMALVFIAIVGTALLLYNTNAFGIKAYVDSSNLMQRQGGAELSGADDYRTSSVLRGFLLVFEHPLGGLKNTLYYHNMWLDIGRISGLLPFLCMLLYTLTVTVHMLRIFSEKLISAEFRYLLLCVYFGVQINFLVEPVLEGLIGFFLMFTMVNGMVECYYHKVFMPLEDLITV